jgi:type II secretory pathway pseudopilin PulG
MKTRETGFTIVELLVTMSFIGITAAGITSLFISIRNVQQQALYVDSATRAAQREIEVLRNDNYSSLTPGQIIDFGSSLPTSLPPSKTGFVTVSQPANDLRRVDVVVTYKANSNTRTITLSSLIGVIGITQ